jgi:hypothetical protein
MAKLIISRSRQFADQAGKYRILIDGDCVGRVAPGKTVAIELMPGRHQISAGLDFLCTQPVAIEAGPDSVHHLKVGSIL